MEQAIIKQMVPFSPRRMVFTRSSESTEKKKTLKKGKGSLGRLLDTAGGSHRLLHTFSILHECHEGEQTTRTRVSCPLIRE